MPRHSFDYIYICASIFSLFFLSFSFLLYFFFSLFFSLLHSYYFVLEFENTWVLYHRRTERKKEKAKNRKEKNEPCCFLVFVQNIEIKFRKSPCKIRLYKYSQENKKKTSPIIVLTKEITDIVCTLNQIVNLSYIMCR